MQKKKKKKKKKRNETKRNETKQNKTNKPRSVYSTLTLAVHAYQKYVWIPPRWSSGRKQTKKGVIGYIGVKKIDTHILHIRHFSAPWV